MNNTTKQQALDKIKELQEEMKKLEQIVNAPEKAGSLLYANTSGARGNAYALTWDCGREKGFLSKNIYDPCRLIQDKSKTTFQSQELADNYAKAFNTFLALRHCEGSEPVKSETQQWSIVIDYTMTYLTVPCSTSTHYKVVELSPMFSSAKHAQAAINTVGEKNIIRMFKTFHHVE